jgi:hypothetical protein
MRRHSHIVKHGKITTTEDLIAQVSNLKGKPGVIDANVDRHIAFLRKTKMVNDPNLIKDIGVKLKDDPELTQAVNGMKFAQSTGLLHGIAPLEAIDNGRVYVRSTRRNLNKLDADPNDIIEAIGETMDDLDSPIAPYITGHNSKNGDVYEVLTGVHELGHKVHFMGGEKNVASKTITKLSSAGKTPADLEDALRRASTKYGQTDVDSIRRETFAEMYTLYVVQGKRLQKEHPLAYDWVDAIVEDSHKVNGW